MKTYTMKEFSEVTGLTAHTLRYYEKIDLLFDIERTQSGKRVYNEHNLYWVNFIKCLKSTGMPIEKIKEYVEMLDLGDVSLDDRRILLENHLVVVQEKILELQENMKHLEYKIKYYKDLGTELERKNKTEKLKKKANDENNEEIRIAK